MNAESPAASTRRVVYFEETGEEREIKSLCRACAKTDEARFAPPSQGVVSPTGVEHIGLNGNTACGKDATGDEWWWPL